MLEQEEAPITAQPAAELPHALRWVPGPPRLVLAYAAGLLLLHLTHPLTWGWDVPGVWFPAAGVGFVFTAWLGPRAAYLVAGHGLLAVLQAWLLGAPLVWGGGWAGVTLGAADAALSGFEVLAAWWCYFHLGRGLRGLIEPRSA